VDKKHLSESDICDKFIRPAMEAAGWNGMDQIYREFPLRAGRVVVRGQGQQPCPGRRHGPGDQLRGPARCAVQLFVEWRRVCVPRRDPGHRHRQDYRWTLHPLSAAGSLTSIGGRFNAGAEIDSRTFDPWPSLYLASDHATAYREKFQIEAGQTVDGLSPEELARAPDPVRPPVPKPDPGGTHKSCRL
jgi:hypothetical protein